MSYTVKETLIKDKAYYVVMSTDGRVVSIPHKEKMKAMSHADLLNIFFSRQDELIKEIEDEKR